MMIATRSSNQLRLLVVNPELPTFDRTSGGLRLFTLMTLLSEQSDVKCDYLVPSRQSEVTRLGELEVNRYVAKMAAHGISFHSGSVSKHLRTNNYDAILFEFFSSAVHNVNTVRTLQSDATLVVDSVDLTYKRWIAMADLTGLQADRIKAIQIERQELGVYALSDLVLTLTDDESNELSQRLPDLRTFEIPNIHSIPNIRRAESKAPSVLFIGSFTHEPNVDGAKWLAREIWPRVVAVRPDARLQIVGQRPPVDLLPQDSYGIEVLGHVMSTEPYLEGAWVSVAPLRFGAGMKGKVGEAMAYALPVVTTQFGAQGYKLESGVSAFVMDTSEGFAEAILKLIDNDELRRSVGAAGHRIVQEAFSRDAMASRIPALVEAIRSSRPTRRTDFISMRRLALQASQLWNEHFAWRFRKSSK